jgi:16S rRNA processing protein RimM
VTASDPSAPDAEFPADAVEVARVLDAWGVKGWIRVQPFAKDPQALFSSRRWFLRPPERASVPHPAKAAQAKPAQALPPLLRIIEAREHGDGVVASVRDVTDRDTAESLRGARIFVPRSSFPSTGLDEYYWVDLIGLQVLNREGLRLGEVTGLIDNGAHSVLQLRAEASPDVDAPPGAQRLIPFVAAYIDQVDLQGRRILVDWGLDY